jgi:hypothetical protein
VVGGGDKNKEARILRITETGKDFVIPGTGFGNIENEANEVGGSFGQLGSGLGRIAIELGDVEPSGQVPKAAIHEGSVDSQNVAIEVFGSSQGVASDSTGGGIGSGGNENEAAWIRGRK